MPETTALEDQKTLSTAGKTGSPKLSANGKKIDTTKAAEDIQTVQALLTQ